MKVRARRVGVVLVLALGGCGNGRRTSWSCRPCECAPCPTPIVAAAAPPAPLAPAEPRPSAVSPIEVSGKEYRGIVFLASAEVIEWLDATEAWAVSPSDVARVEAGFPAAVKAALPSLSHPLKEYYRQYVGVVREGKRKIAILAMSEGVRSEQEGWEKKTFLRIMDGGDSYIDALFDVASGRFDSVAPHGEA